MGFNALGFTPRPFNPNANQNFGGDVTVAGNAGFGTDSPAYNVHIRDATGSANLFLEGTGAAKDANIRLGNDGTTHFICGYDTSEDAFKITRSGYNTPDFTIDGSGGIDVANNLAVGGDLIATTKTPASVGATGTAGTIAWDASYIYIATATDTWKRVAIATW